MKISAVNSYYSNQYKKQKSLSYNPTFTEHRDYIALRWKHGVDPDGTPYINASSYFRRGNLYKQPIEQYKDVINVFSKIFSSNRHQKTMLIVGVADSQEPFSHLASIKEIIGHKSLKKALNLHIVDLKSKPDMIDLYSSSFFDGDGKPKFASSSFEKSEKLQMYKVKDEIYTFLEKTYQDPQKSKWEKRIQDAAKEYPSETFDIISINNVLPYIENQEEIDSTLYNLYRSLKPNGVLIADPYHEGYSVKSPVFDNMEEIYDGIYKKSAQNLNHKITLMKRALSFIL